jgi:hypothetical protein
MNECQACTLILRRIGSLLSGAVKLPYLDEVKTCGFALALCALGLENGVSERNRTPRPRRRASRAGGRVRFALPEPLGLSASLMRANRCLRTAERFLSKSADSGRGLDQLFERYVRSPGSFIPPAKTSSSSSGFVRTLEALGPDIHTNRLRIKRSTNVWARCTRYRHDWLKTGMTRSLRVLSRRRFTASSGSITSGDATSYAGGYRLSGGVAPLKVTIAAAILFLSGLEPSAGIARSLSAARAR